MLLLLLVEGLEESLSSRSFSNAPVADEAPVTGNAAAELRGACEARVLQAGPPQEPCGKTLELTCVPVACASKSASPDWEEPPGQGPKQHDSNSHSRVVEILTGHREGCGHHKNGLQAQSPGFRIGCELACRMHSCKETGVSAHAGGIATAQRKSLACASYKRDWEAGLRTTSALETLFHRAQTHQACPRLHLILWISP